MAYFEANIQQFRFRLGLPELIDGFQGLLIRAFILRDLLLILLKDIILLKML